MVWYGINHNVGEPVYFPLNGATEFSVCAHEKPAKSSLQMPYSILY